MFLASTSSMKRIATHIVITALVLVAALVGATYFGTQALLWRYRPQLMAEITDSLGCPVRYGRATLRLNPGLEVVLYDVEVMGTDLGFEVTSPYLSAEVKLRALLNRHLDFEQVTLRSPSIVLITGTRTAAHSQPAQGNPATVSTGQASTTSASQRTTPLTGIDLIRIESGRISKRKPGGPESVIVEDLHITSGVTTQGSTISISPSEASFILPIRIKGDKRLPFSATLEQLSYSIDPKTVSITRAHLVSGSSSLSVSVSMDIDTGAVTGNVNGSKVGIGIIQQILGTSGLAGTADIQAAVTFDDQSFTATGNAGVTNAQAGATTGEKYGVASLSGPFSVSIASGQQTTIQSDTITVHGFSYTDTNVSLTHVNGTLSGISGTIKPDGSASFGVTVKGTELDLAAGPFSIKRIASVDAPLTITIPAQPGYSITGPVRAAGIDMTFHGRQMFGASGSVDMLVSDKLLRFTSHNIKTESNKVPISLSGTIECTNEAYQGSHITGALAGGSLAGSVTMQRAPRQGIETEILAKGLDISAVKALATGEPQEPFSGIVNHISVKATARRDTLLPSATGVGVIQITDGTVRNATYDKKVVGIIKAIPVVGEAVSFTANVTNSSTYQMQGGMLKELTADFTIGGEKLLSKNIKGIGRFTTIQPKFGSKPPAQSPSEIV
ncbi:MAG: hypothetical protein RIS36_1102 [Pseudomonadota bacterium]|jgi:hypothetical protein